MGNSFFEYLQQLELIAFFSGYPLVYAVVLFFAGNKRSKNKFKTRLVLGLPFAYALTGTLYLGLQLKKLYFNYSHENVAQLLHQPYLVIWGLLSIFFWIPALSKKKELSLIHGLVFFFLLVRDFIVRFDGLFADKDMLRNDMRVYIISILLNLGAFAIIVLLSFLFTHNKKRLRS